MNILGWFPLRIDWFDFLGVQGTLKSSLQHHRWKTSFFQHSAFFMVHLSHLYDYWKKIALTRWTFVSKVMSLIFNVLPKSVIDFLPRSNRLLISWLQSYLQWFCSPPPQKKKKMSVTVSIVSPSICHGPSSESYDSSSSQVWMEELDHKESWALKSWCFWTVESEKTCESHLDCKEIQPVNPKGNQSWIFIERTDAEAEALILWPPFAKNWLIRKDPVAQKIGLESGWQTVWEKETRDRIKDLKMGMENSRPSESRTLFFRVTSLLFSVLACRKYLLCHNVPCPW